MQILTANDILTIPRADMPIIVLTDRLRSFASWAIEAHTEGRYNHCMMLYRNAHVASQDWLYSAAPIASYLRGRHRVKLWTNPAWPRLDRLRVLCQIENDLAAPWWQRVYDVPGVIGQLIGCNWLQWPWTMYCSERVGGYLRMLEPSFSIITPTPADIDVWAKANHLQCLGVYDQELSK